MNSVIGNKIEYSIFGESHGEEIGIVINGLDSGLLIDYNKIDEELFRRRPKKDGTTTSRIEKDNYRIVSGIFNGYTTGAPLTIIVKNEDCISKDYDKFKQIMRPGHADYTAYVKYAGFNDYRGSGHFSGRITTPLVIAGSILKQILLCKGIEIFSRIKSIGSINDKAMERFNSFEDYNEFIENFKIMRTKELNGKLPLFSDIESEVKEYVKAISLDKDSIGGSIECIVTGIEAGFGNPFFHSIESVISHYIFSIPAIKAIEFGDGIDMSKMKGSKSNDSFRVEDGKIITTSNHSGGINGGISNGMPIVFTSFVKATSSIARIQDTVDINNMSNVTLDIEGRHDPCIALRMCPIIEAVAAMAILNIIQE